MSEALKALNNIRILRAQARATDLTTLEEMLERLTMVVNERRTKAESVQAKVMERDEKLRKYRDMLIAEGIHPVDLMPVPGTVKNKAKREALSAKYSYTNQNGLIQTWTGKGRMPKSIADAIAAGKSLEDFQI